MRVLVLLMAALAQLHAREFPKLSPSAVAKAMALVARMQLDSEMMRKPLMDCMREKEQKDINKVLKECMEKNLGSYLAVLRYTYHFEKEIFASAKTEACKAFSKAIDDLTNETQSHMDAVCGANRLLHEVACGGAHNACPAEYRTYTVVSWLEVYDRGRCKDTRYIYISRSYKSPDSFYDKRTAGALFAIGDTCLGAISPLVKWILIGIGIAVGVCILLSIISSIVCSLR